MEDVLVSENPQKNENATSTVGSERPVKVFSLITIGALTLLIVSIVSYFSYQSLKQLKVAKNLAVKDVPAGESFQMVANRVAEASAPEKEAVTNPSQEATSTEMAVIWKTYTSRNGYTIKYPSSWQLLPQGSQQIGNTEMTFYSGKLPGGAEMPTGIVLSLLDPVENTNQLSAEDFARQFPPLVTGIPESVNVDLQTLTIAGKPAAKIVASGSDPRGETIEYIFTRENLVYPILVGIWDQPFDADKRLADQVVASIKFLDTEVAPIDWKHFSNKDAPFTLDYPPEWQFFDNQDAHYGEESKNLENQTVTFSGSGNNISIIWGKEILKTPPNVDSKVNVKLKNAQMDAQHYTMENGSQAWLITKPTSEDTFIQINAVAGKEIHDSDKLIMSILATFRFTN